MPAKDINYSYAEIKGADGVLKEVVFMPSTLETIDTALFDYIDKGLDIHTKTNKGWKKAPVIWVSAERAFQIKNNKELRDSKGTLKLPLLTLSRDSISKDSNFKGVAWSHIPPINDPKGGFITVARTINQQKTANFKNAYSFKRYRQNNFPSEKDLTVYNTMTMPMPTYIAVTYSIGIRAEYQQQINEILTPFVTKTGQINNSSNMGGSERSYETTISVRILGYLLGEGSNSDRPKIAIRENAVTLVQARERTSLGEDERG